MKNQSRAAYRIAAPIKNAVQRFAYLGLIVTAFAVMLLGKADVVLMERIRANVTDAVAPIIDVLSRPAATVSDIVDQVSELARLREENIRLRGERDRLMNWQAAARRLEAENKSLRGLLSFEKGPAARFVTGRVIADTGGVFAHSLVVTAGIRDGITKGQAVMTGVGLVGRVAEVGRRSSRILLITDINSRIPVLNERTRVRAILAGNNSEQPGLIHLPPGETASPGDRIVTSGHGGVFPPGLAVGVVSAVSEAGIAVRPFVKRSRLEYVRVVDFGLDGILGQVRPDAPQENTGKAHVEKAPNKKEREKR